MSKSTTLASGQVTLGHPISVELVEPANMPAVVRIVWPPKATVANRERVPAHRGHDRPAVCGGLHNAGRDQDP